LLQGRMCIENATASVELNSAVGVVDGTVKQRP